VQPQLDFGFAEGLRALMRQDPDIIMVGEIRDLETAEMAVQAALTGHLVFSTLHTNDAPSAITRLMELGVPPYLLNATLLGVLAQRLVRTLCPLCKRVDDEASTALLAEAVRPWKINGQLPPYQAVGCVECRMTGYRGRMGMYELLAVSDAFAPRCAATWTWRRCASRRWPTACARCAWPARCAADGLTTLAEVIAATPPLQ
jgi:general secretion pathway protein E